VLRQTAGSYRGIGRMGRRHARSRLTVQQSATSHSSLTALRAVDG
jgi:hypothetical protein